MARRILVFQHCAAEHLGRFLPRFRLRQIEPVVVRLDLGEAIPDPAGFDGLWVLGGPQQVWEEARFPWLIAEKAAIRRAVLDCGLPYFGLCLGHQLLAEALGGRADPAAAPEVGILPVHLTEAGQAHPLFAGMAPSLMVVQGHGAEVAQLPAEAVVLATSPACAVQAMQVGDTAFSVQFHMELTPEMIDACLELPEYKADFDAMLGVEGVQRFLQENRARADALDADAGWIFCNWLALVSGCDRQDVRQGLEF